jgi:dephospho-CoA kinase
LVRLRANMNNPIVVGLVGGVASGKSEVSRQLQSHGAHVVHADAIGHEVLREPDVREALVIHFGNSILSADATEIDRSQLAKRVFGDDPAIVSERRHLESIVHPRIRQRIADALDAARRAPEIWLIVLDVPLLIESGWVESCQRVIMVEAQEAIRLSRAMDRGWTESAFRERERSQTSLGAKRAAATDIIDNSGSMESLREQVVELVASMRQQFEAIARTGSS